MSSAGTPGGNRVGVRVMERSQRARVGRIVIVDDDRVSVRMLQGVLAANGFTNVSSFDDPQEALDRVIAEGADLLLLDLHMPELDGFTFMRQLRERLRVGDWPAVLMLTADETRGVKEQALALGVRDFLNKPFPPVETVLRVENVLEVHLLTRRLAEDNANLESVVAQRVSELATVTTADTERRATAIKDAADAMAFLAHELRAPLTVISGFAQLLAQDAEEGILGDTMEAADAIVRQTEHMVALIEKLVDRYSSGGSKR